MSERTAPPSANPLNHLRPHHRRIARVLQSLDSDVLAGWVLGGTWMVCTVLIMDSMARWRGAPAALARQ